MEVQKRTSTECKTIQCGIEQSFQQMMLWQQDSHMQKN